HQLYWDGEQGVVCRDVPVSTGISLWTAFHPAENSAALIPGLRMRLKEVRIKGYRSVRNQIRVLIDEKMTILVGANDHGKSNILRAIQNLNDESPFTQDDVNWDSEENDSPQVEWDFDLAAEPSADAQEPLVEASGGLSKPSPTIPQAVTFVRKG